MVQLISNKLVIANYIKMNNFCIIIDMAAQLIKILSRLARTPEVGPLFQKSAIIKPQSAPSKLCPISVVPASQPDNCNTSAGPVVPSSSVKSRACHVSHPSLEAQCLTREKGPGEKGERLSSSPRDGHTMLCMRHKSRKRCPSDAHTGFSLVRPSLWGRRVLWLRKRVPQAHHPRIPKPGADCLPPFFLLVALAINTSFPGHTRRASPLSSYTLFLVFSSSHSRLSRFPLARAYGGLS
jgi:hypothetical protein